jgi:hypothetical protein
MHIPCAERFLQKSLMKRRFLINWKIIIADTFLETGGSANGITSCVTHLYVPNFSRQMIYQPILILKVENSITSGNAILDLTKGP